MLVTEALALRKGAARGMPRKPSSKRDLPRRLAHLGVTGVACAGAVDDGLGAAHHIPLPWRRTWASESRPALRALSFLPGLSGFGGITSAFAGRAGSLIPRITLKEETRWTHGAAVRPEHHRPTRSAFGLSRSPEGRTRLGTEYARRAARDLLRAFENHRTQPRSPNYSQCHCWLLSSDLNEVVLRPLQPC